MKLNLSVSPLSLAAMLPALIALLWYAIKVWKRKSPPTSFASFLMWTIMDMLLVVNALRTGQPIWMQLGFTIGASAVTYTLWKRGTFVWTIDETLTAICSAAALSLLFIANGTWGLFGTTLAMTIAGWPAFRDNRKNPVRDTLPMWFTTVIGCVLSLYGSSWNSWDAFILPLMCGSYNALMSIVVLRRVRPTRSEVAILATA